MQPLRGAEDLPAKAVRDHHVVPDRHVEHGVSPLSATRLVRVGTRCCWLVPVGERVTQRRQVAAREPGHHLGQCLEGGLAGQQGVEGRVPEQVEGEREPVGRRPAPASCRGDRADLAGAHREATRVEGSAEPEGRLVVAVPAELDDRALRREQVQRLLEAGGGGARVHDQVATARRLLGEGEVDAQRRRDAGARGVDVDQRDRDSRDPDEQPGHAAAEGPGPHDRHPVADKRCGVPQRVHGRLDDSGEHRPRHRHVRGYDGHGRGRHDVRSSGAGAGRTPYDRPARPDPPRRPPR